MNRTVRKVAERLRKRNSFEDLLNIYEQDKGAVTLPARLAVTALASFEHADAVTAELNVQQTSRVAAAQATQAPKGPPPGMPGDAARVLYPQPHHGGAGGGGGGQPPPGGGQPDYPMAPPGQPEYPMGTSRGPPASSWRRRRWCAKGGWCCGGGSGATTRGQHGRFYVLRRWATTTRSAWRRRWYQTAGRQGQLQH